MAIELLFHSAKGGVGKSTLSILAAEYFLSREYSLDLTDASGNPTAQKWIGKCRDLGRADEFSSSQPDIRIIDTKGIPGSAAPFFARAALILIPFQPFSEDVEESLDVFDSLDPEQKKQAVFIPNRLRALGLTNEQHAVMAELRDFIAEAKAGRILPGLVERVAIYPLLLNGIPRNFFSMKVSNPSFQKAQTETGELFDAITHLLPL